MIFVTLGTQDKEFKRLLENVEQLIDKGIIKEKVIAQIGCTKFSSNKMKLIDYLNKDDMLKYMSDCDYIICHGGVGTIFDSLNLNKKIIAVARLKKYKEHVNDHQLQIIENFNAKGYIIGTKGVEEIESALEKVESFEQKKYESNNKEFVKKLENSIM